MGVKTILSAKKIYILAFSEGKSQIVYKSIEGPITPEIPTTFLQKHGDCTFILDESVNNDN